MIYRAALKDPNIFLLTGDLEHPVVNDFKKNIPAQHINVGMAEQNMIGIAAGLALSGKKVFVLGIIPFVTFRCLEQIRNDVCYQNADVTVIGEGGGFFYSEAGPTHHGTEDIGAMRVLPNLKIVAPADPEQAGLLIEKVIFSRGPFYFRLAGKNAFPIDELRSGDNGIEIGKGQVVREGKDISIFSYGATVLEALAAADILDRQGHRTEVVNFHTLKPIDRELVGNRAYRRKVIFTLEEHVLIGGLGSAIAEIICSTHFGEKLIFKSFGIDNCFVHDVGSRQYLRRIHGLTGPQVADQILSFL
ncbi:MAG: transketolase C-terminal domain-containing protein [Minisyncoccia bacterium]